MPTNTVNETENLSRRRKTTTEASLVDEAAGEEAGKRRSLKPLLALKPYLLRYKGVLVAAAISLVASAAATLVVPIAVRRVIDNGFTSDNGALIDQYFTVLIIIGAVLAVSSAARFYFVNWLGERVVSDLRSDVFSHLTRLGAGFFAQTHSGEVMSRLTADTTQIKSAAGSALSQALRNMIMLVGALVMMLVTSFELSLLVLVAIPVIVLPLMAYGRVVRRLSRRAQDELAEASAFASENLGAIQTMQAFVSEKSIVGRFVQAVERAFDAARDRLLARAGLTAIAIFLTTASIVAVLWYGASAVIAGEITGGRLSQFVLYAVFAAAALAALAEVWGEMSQAAGASERLMELLSVDPEIKQPENPLPLPVPPRGSIAFEGVRFSYPARDGETALAGIDLAVAPGESVALVGPSGAGKSTLFHLLLRFYDPQAGRVTVDGVDVSKVSLAELRGRIAVVPQDVALFAETIADNIAYGASTASREEVIEAAKLAQADGFIRALPDGYDTRLGERGVTLSGGQRQRIALARALLKDAPILLLDEATSALDAESEQAVQRALERVMRGRTTLVIAHRLATVQKADRIVVMDEGRIVEEGTHQSLVARGGLYSRLATLQFGLEAAE